MRDSIHKYFRLGTIQWMSHPKRNVLQSLRTLLSDPDLDAIEIRHFEDSNEREQARRLLAQSHMRVCYGAQPTLLAGLNANSLQEEERKKAEQALLSAVDEAEYLGANGIAFLAGKWEEKTKEEAFQALVKTTKTVCAYAASKSMQVELEVFDYNMDKAALIGPAPLAARFAAEIRSSYPNFGLLVDLSHFPTTYETSRDVIRTLRPYITHLHIGNAVVRPGCEAYGDQHPRFGFPNSANDTKELLDFLRVLREEGFFCSENPYVLSFEVKPWEGEEEDIIFANSKRTLQRAWALLEENE